MGKRNSIKTRLCERRVCRHLLDKFDKHFMEKNGHKYFFARKKTNIWWWENNLRFVLNEYNHISVVASVQVESSMSKNTNCWVSSSFSAHFNGAAAAEPAPAAAFFRVLMRLQSVVSHSETLAYTFSMTLTFGEALVWCCCRLGEATVPAVCHKTVTTRVNDKIKNMGWIWCLAWWLFSCIIPGLLIFCLNGFK